MFTGSAALDISGKGPSALAASAPPVLTRKSLRSWRTREVLRTRAPGEIERSGVFVMSGLPPLRRRYMVQLACLLLFYTLLKARKAAAPQVPTRVSSIHNSG